MHDLFDRFELAGGVVHIERFSMPVAMNFVDHREEVNLLGTHEFSILLHFLCYNLEGYSHE